jgi:hypothetical protein
MRPKIPVGLLLAVAVLLGLGAAAGPVIRSMATPEQLSANILLDALPFILIFVAIILAFIALIAMAAGALNHRVSAAVYRPIETVLIAGIVLGVLGMFQPWLHLFYKWGFVLLLVSTLGFILWSHVVPRAAPRRDEPGSLSVAEFEQRDAGRGQD